MATITYDVTETEEFEAYAGPTPKRGKYEAVIRSAEFGESKKGTPMFTIMVVLDSKKKDQKQYNGCPLWQYYTIDDLSEEWMKRNLKAVVKLAGMKEKGKLNTDALCKKLNNMRVFVLVKNEMYKAEGDTDGELVARANGLYPFKAASDDADDDDDVVEDDEDEGDDEDEDAEDDEDEEDEDEDEATVEDEVADLDRAGLKKYIKDNELDIKVNKNWSDDKLRAAIVAAFEEEDEDDEDADGDEPF